MLSSVNSNIPPGGVDPNRPAKPMFSFYSSNVRRSLNSTQRILVEGQKSTCGIEPNSVAVDSPEDHYIHL